MNPTIDILFKSPIFEYFKKKDIKYWMDFMSYLSGDTDFSHLRNIEFCYVKTLFDIIKINYESLFQDDVTYFDIIKCASRMKGGLEPCLSPAFQGTLSCDTERDDDCDAERDDISKYFINDEYLK
ncbi:MAG: hypothetical protein ACOCRX_05735 [Candidatus Woesearchaeota archaeon]